MSSPLDSQALRELAAGYVLGDLSSEEAEQFHQLIQQVPALSIEVAALQAALHMMPYGLTEQQPKAELRSQTIQAIQTAMMPPTTELTTEPTASIVPTPTQPQITQQNFPQRQRRLLSGLAAGLLIALGVGVSQHPLQTQTASTQAPQPTAQSPQPNPTENAWAGFRQLLDDHRSALNNPQGPADFASQPGESILTQLTEFQTTEAALPMLPQSQATLLGVSNCQFGKNIGLRLSFQANDYPNKEQIVSAYQLDLQNEPFPQFPPNTLTLRQLDNINIVFWREESYLYALVADVPAANLSQLAHSVSRI